MRLNKMLTTGLIVLCGVALQAQSMATISDFTWCGRQKFPEQNGGTATGPGTNAFVGGQMAVHYLATDDDPTNCGTTKRIIMPTFKNGTDGVDYQAWGDLVEYCPKQNANGHDKLNMLASDDTTETLHETRRWWGQGRADTSGEGNWVAHWGNHSGTDTYWGPNMDVNGEEIGALLWDTPNGTVGGVWHTVYANYSGDNQAFLAFTELTNTADANHSGYKAVGTQAGPWWYRDTSHTGAAHAYYKSVSNFITYIQDSATRTAVGHSYLFGGTVGSVGGDGQIGIGFVGLDLPSLTCTVPCLIGSTTAGGTLLADYTWESACAFTVVDPNIPADCHKTTGLSPNNAIQNATRSTDYVWRPGIGDVVCSEGSCQPETGTGAVGFWTMSADNGFGLTWIQTGTTASDKWAVVAFGRIVKNHGTNDGVWYGDSPNKNSSGVGYPAGCDITSSCIVDLSVANYPNSGGHGYFATAFDAALWAFDPSTIKSVASGTLHHDNRGINPTNLGNWHTQPPGWPNLPVNLTMESDFGTQARPTYQWPSGQTGFWDNTAKLFYFLQPDSYKDGLSPVPTYNVFVVNGTCPN